MGPILSLALLMAACGGDRPASPRRVARPVRVMSINQCTDQLLLALVPPERIASVSWLARDTSGSLLRARALRVPVNHGSAEEVAAQRPGLVLAGAFSTPATRALLTQLGFPMVEVPFAESLADIRATTRQVARAVGEVARGEALIARMDRQFAALARDPGPRVRVAAWDGSGFGARPGSLQATIIAAAGAVDVAAAAGAGGAAPDVERLLAAAPALLIRGGRAGDVTGLHDAVARHPVVRRYWGTARTIVLPSAAYQCGTPFVGDAALKLRADLNAARRRIEAPPAQAARS